MNSKPVSDDLRERLEARMHDHRFLQDSTGTWPVPIRSNELSDLIAAHESQASTIHDLQQQVKALREALTGLEAFFERPDEGRCARFDRLAEDFYRETGVMAPGKSMPLEMEMSGPSDEERRERYDAWVAAKVERARQALKTGDEG